MASANNTRKHLWQKIEQHNTEPDNDLQEYIPYSEIHDEDTDEETKFVVIFATKPTLSFLNRGDTLHIAATYRIGWCGMDPKDTQTKEWLSYDSLWNNRKTGKFHGSFSVLAHDEKAWTWNKVYTFVHERDVIRSLGWVTVPLPLRKPRQSCWRLPRIQVSWCQEKEWSPKEAATMSG